MAQRKFLDETGLALFHELMKIYVDGKIFVGTMDEYEAADANGEVKIGTLVCIIDDEGSSGGSGGSGSGSGESSSTSTSSKLGEGALGYMILG